MVQSWFSLTSALSCPAQQTGMSSTISGSTLREIRARSRLSKRLIWRMVEGKICREATQRQLLSGFVPEKRCYGAGSESRKISRVAHSQRRGGRPLSDVHLPLWGTGLIDLGSGSHLRSRSACVNKPGPRVSDLMNTRIASYLEAGQLPDGLRLRMFHLSHAKRVRRRLSPATASDLQHQFEQLGKYYEHRNGRSKSRTSHVWK
jgi:hypothetical protein